MRPLLRDSRQPEPALRSANLFPREQDDVDPFVFLKTIWRGKSLIMSLTTLSAIAAVVYFEIFAVTTYRSSAVLMLDIEQRNVAGFEPMTKETSDSKEVMGTEVEVVRSRKIGHEVVAALALAEDPEFNVVLRPAPALPIKDYIADARAWLRALVTPVEAPKERSAGAALAGTVDNLISALSVNNVSDSNILTISVESLSPNKAALIANTVAETYVTRGLRERFEANGRTSELLAERVAELKGAVEDSTRRYDAFQMAAEMTSIEDVDFLNRQLKEFRARHTLSERKVAEASDVVAALASIAAGADPDDYPVLVGRRASEMLAKADGLSPELRASLVDELIVTATAQQTQELKIAQTLAESIRRLEEKLDRQSAELQAAGELRREVEASSIVYEQARTRLKELSVEAELQVPRARVISEAEVPSDPSSPRKALIFFIALMSGGLAGSALAIVREGTRTTFRTAEEVEQRTGGRVVAEIPMLLPHRTTPFSEAVRNFRTSVMMANNGRPPGVVAFTSCMPGDGKTLLTHAFSQSLAAVGSKVVCIDADLRRRTLSERLGFGDIDHGVAAAAAAPPAQIGRFVVSGGDGVMDFLPAGQTDMNPADLFASPGFRRLIETLRNTYSCIVIDTPPALVLPDARAISATSDAVYLVIRWDNTTKWQALDALRDLEVSGMVLNQMEPKRMRKYGYHDRRAVCGYDSAYMKELA